MDCATEGGFQQDECGYQEQINLLLLASALFLASLYSDSKEKGLLSCVDCWDFSESDKNMLVSGHITGCKRAFAVMGLWHVCSIAGVRDLGL